jgi:hypothetical protein
MEEKKSLGILDLDTSLKYLLGNCTDFEEEETMLQLMGTKMGVLVDRTPKCHPELAGKGIEYPGAVQRTVIANFQFPKKKEKRKFYG